MLASFPKSLEYKCKGSITHLATRTGCALCVVTGPPKSAPLKDKLPSFPECPEGVLAGLWEMNYCHKHRNSKNDNTLPWGLLLILLSSVKMQKSNLNIRERPVRPLSLVCSLRGFCSSQETPSNKPEPLNNVHGLR